MRVEEEEAEEGGLCAHPLDSPRTTSEKKKKRERERKRQQTRVVVVLLLGLGVFIDLLCI